MDSIRTSTSTMQWLGTGAERMRTPHVQAAPAGSQPDRVARGPRSSPLLGAENVPLAFRFGEGRYELAIIAPQSSVVSIRTISSAPTRATVPVPGLLDVLDFERVAIARPSALDVSAVRDVGGVHPSFDLRAIERGVPGHPHTLAQHVGKDDAFLKARIANGKHEASTYEDLAAAQRSTDAVIGDPQNQNRISTWIAGGAIGNLRLDGSVSGTAIGRVLSREDVAVGSASRETNHATVILKSDAASTAAYTILTSYPSFQASVA